jgi:Tfp pilus assembly protein PilF
MITRITLLIVFISLLACSNEGRVNKEETKEVQQKLIKLSREEFYFNKNAERAYVFLDSAISLGAKSFDVYNSMGVICDYMNYDVESYEYFKRAFSMAKTKKRFVSSL